MKENTKEIESKDKDDVKDNLKTHPEEMSQKEVDEAICKINPDPNLLDRG